MFFCLTNQKSLLTNLFLTVKMRVTCISSVLSRTGITVPVFDCLSIIYL
ncbi:hypothetical protein MCHI_000805 [Candidatus Magnetoovum chiemensis]|nr:hypothetical protein MCHI_000805 [Candidatus Magnetoovum chiemensis]